MSGSGNSQGFKLFPCSYNGNEIRHPLGVRVGSLLRVDLTLSISTEDEAGYELEEMTATRFEPTE